MRQDGLWLDASDIDHMSIWFPVVLWGPDVGEGFHRVLFPRAANNPMCRERVVDTITSTGQIILDSEHFHPLDAAGGYPRLWGMEDSQGGTPVRDAASVELHAPTLTPWRKALPPGNRSEDGEGVLVTHDLESEKVPHVTTRKKRRGPQRTLADPGGVRGDAAEDVRDEGRDSGTLRGDASLLAGVDLKMESQDRDSRSGRGDDLHFVGVDLKEESELGPRQDGRAAAAGTPAGHAPRRWWDNEDAGGPQGWEKTLRPATSRPTEPPD